MEDKPGNQKTGRPATESNSQNNPEPKHRKTTTFPHVAEVNLLSVRLFSYRFYCARLASLLLCAGILSQLFHVLLQLAQSQNKFSLA